MDPRTDQRTDRRTPVTLVTGLNREANARIANALAVPGTAFISHDLRALPLGYVVRQTRQITGDGDRFSIEGVQLEHGCATCTLRLDLLPMLWELHRDETVERIVVVLDPAFEPEPVVAEILGTIVEFPGGTEGVVGDHVVVRATVTAVTGDSWLNDATGDLTLYEAGLSEVEDERSLAQVAVAQTRFADVMVIEDSGNAETRYELARLQAALRRVNPAAIQTVVRPDQEFGTRELLVSLAAVRPESRRGRLHTAFDPLLDGCPPLEADCGIEIVTFEADRAFHPERLHDALDVLLDGVITARGRLWLTSSPDDVLWLESAGESLGVSRVARWIAARGEDEMDSITPEMHAMASLHWNDEHGDRHSSIVAVTHRADPVEIEQALREALLTDEEIALGADHLAALPSPFGDVHIDPCEDSDGSPSSVEGTREITTEETTR
ncbi:MAG: GTP-binding protein [Gordonia sp. (in: high G+C Gram-positive bacteria)]|uniref:ribosome hibernation factor-recruiting GTPase MRF n=1 Tax=Gordonia sp. (in: high G+C Gram-positive bacteria) TaxID=84139 RepID=UPI0039E28657